MEKDELIQQFKSMPWEMWLHRRFSPFVTYLMMKAATSAEFMKEGIDAQFPFALYDTDDWYGTPLMFVEGGAQAKQFLKQKNIFELTKRCEEILEQGRRELPLLITSNLNPRAMFERALSLIIPGNVYIWVAHAAEHYYHPLIREAVRKYVPAKEVETFIGDISFPSKKNALALLETDVRAGMLPEELHRKYAWINARGGFRSGYTLNEIREIKDKILAEPAKPRHTREIPQELEALAKEVQELVYLRTLRTDALYEMYYLAQPAFELYAKELGIDSVKDYIPDELLEGKFMRVPHKHAILKYDDEVLVLRESIISELKVTKSDVKGIVAFKGKASGLVRLVFTPSDALRVQIGDVLVSNMTTPAYISAMHRAVAFVTDEGGITCHAAILARELKKPCITGTKNATQVLKDGDLVEVDADEGVVKILN